MSAVIVDGKAIAAELRAEIAAEIVAMTEAGSRPPSLAVVLCGDDPASAIYVRNKGRAAERAGVDVRAAQAAGGEHHRRARRPGQATRRRPRASTGSWCSCPLPAHVDAQAVTECISQSKDADGFHPYNFGRLAEGHPAVVAPGTPLGCMELLRRSGVPLRGSRAVVIGRSAIVGRPLALHAHQRRLHGDDLPLAEPRTSRRSAARRTSS